MNDVQAAAQHAHNALVAALQGDPSISADVCAIHLSRADRNVKAATVRAMLTGAQALPFADALVLIAREGLWPQLETLVLTAVGVQTLTLAEEVEQLKARVVALEVAK